MACRAVRRQEYLLAEGAGWKDGGASFGSPATRSAQDEAIFSMPSKPILILSHEPDALMSRRTRHRSAAKPKSTDGGAGGSRADRTVLDLEGRARAANTCRRRRPGARLV